ncbi:MAG: hypothetical protein AUH85_08490 [Chloroflexi bacterium 13_1_40CM_4_68_4]|nr:MAG: hypothetical protein AUH85_08490 [Chloroflexi bacterium 13_1_40CM_4_68_4]
MIRFAVPRGADPVALRLAIAACREPLRVERRAGLVSVVAREGDASRGGARWLRAGLEPEPCEEWPEARRIAAGVLLAQGAAWCVAVASLTRLPAHAHLVLLLTPVSRDDALRAIANALRSPLRIPFRREPRSLARIGSAVVCGRDGVAAARAYVLASGPEAADAYSAFRATAGSGARMLRSGALGGWREIGAQTGGVWRALSALEAWWS